MSETELSFDAQCPRCTGRTTRHRFRNRAEIKERLIDGTLTLYCAWCEQSRQPTAAEQDFLLQWIFDTDEPAPLETAPSAEALKPGMTPHLEIDWPITLPATVDVGDFVISAESEWFTFGRVTEERGRVYLGSSRELLIACYLASQHAAGHSRVWYADPTGTFTEYVYEVG